MASIGNGCRRELLKSDSKKKWWQEITCADDDNLTTYLLTTDSESFVENLDQTSNETCLHRVPSWSNMMDVDEASSNYNFPVTPTTKHVIDRSLKSLYDPFETEKRKLNIPNDPRSWSQNQVKQWLYWGIKHFDISNFCIENFALNGQNLCELSKSAFLQRTPIDTGEILWHHLETMKVEAYHLITDQKLFFNDQTLSAAMPVEFAMSRKPCRMTNRIPSYQILQSPYQDGLKQYCNNRSAKFDGKFNLAEESAFSSACREIEHSPSSGFCDESSRSPFGSSESQIILHNSCGDTAVPANQFQKVSYDRHPQQMQCWTRTRQHSNIDGNHFAPAQSCYINAQNNFGDFRLACNEIPVRKSYSTGSYPDSAVFINATSPACSLPGDLDRLDLVQMSIADFNNTGQPQLWQFLLTLLMDKRYQNVISWTGNEWEFKIIDIEEVPKLWGIRKNKPKMNYEKMSRSLRYYYDKNIIHKTAGQRYVYKFMIDLGTLLGKSPEQVHAEIGCRPNDQETADECSG